MSAVFATFSLPRSFIPEVCTTPPPKRSRRAVETKTQSPPREDQPAEVLPPTEVAPQIDSAADVPTETASEETPDPVIKQEEPKDDAKDAAAQPSETDITVTLASQAEPLPAPDDITVTMHDAPYEGLTLRELKAMCLERGISDKGKKQELISRLSSSVPQ